MGGAGGHSCVQRRRDQGAGARSRSVLPGCPTLALLVLASLTVLTPTLALTHAPPPSSSPSSALLTLALLALARFGLTLLALASVPSLKLLILWQPWRPRHQATAEHLTIRSAITIIIIFTTDTVAILHESF